MRSPTARRFFQTGLGLKQGDSPLQSLVKRQPLRDSAQRPIFTESLNIFDCVVDRTGDLVGEVEDLQERDGSQEAIDPTQQLRARRRETTARLDPCGLLGREKGIESAVEPTVAVGRHPA